MDSTNNVSSEYSSLNFQPDLIVTDDVSNEDQLSNNSRSKENMAPVPDDIDIPFDFKKSWESCKSLIGSVQECTSQIIKQEESEEFQLSECLEYLKSENYKKFIGFNQLNERSVESNDKNSNIDERKLSL